MGNPQVKPMSCSSHHTHHTIYLTSPSTAANLSTAHVFDASQHDHHHCLPLPPLPLPPLPGNHHHPQPLPHFRKIHLSLTITTPENECEGSFSGMFLVFTISPFPQTFNHLPLPYPFSLHITSPPYLFLFSLSLHTPSLLSSLSLPPTEVRCCETNRKTRHKKKEQMFYF